jgi:hypothetical protein
MYDPVALSLDCDHLRIPLKISPGAGVPDAFEQRVAEVTATFAVYHRAQGIRPRLDCDRPKIIAVPPLVS